MARMRDFLKLNSACVDATELTTDSIGELAIYWPEDIDCDVKNITEVAQLMQKGFTAKDRKTTGTCNHDHACILERPAVLSG